MVFLLSDFNVQTNDPLPWPQTIVSFDIFGGDKVLQQTPFFAIAVTPSKVKTPPVFAEWLVISVIAMVDNTGNCPPGSVLKSSSFTYVTPYYDISKARKW